MEKKKLKWEIPELVALSKAANGIAICQAGSSNETGCDNGSYGKWFNDLSPYQQRRIIEKSISIEVLVLK